MKKSEFDVIIIGGGQAGIPLAHALAGAKKRVVLIERENLGGSCVNFGCTPTKAAIASARVAHLARRAKEFGLKIPQVEVDFPAVLKRASGIALGALTAVAAAYAGQNIRRAIAEQTEVHSSIVGAVEDIIAIRIGAAALRE